jgi:5-methyltetrahydrofolate--homocysteine methyltransferase
VFYCKDAFEGLESMDRLVNPKVHDEFVTRIIQEGREEMGKAEKADKAAKPQRRSAIQPAPDVPNPPFWGTKTIERMSTEIVLTHLSKNELFRLSWGAKNAHGEEWEKLSAEFEDRLQKLSKEAIKNKWIYPQAVYGYFPANCDGDDLIIYDPEPFGGSNGNVPAKREIARFKFPRQPDGEHLCISDYFRPANSGEVDVAAFQIVTVGEAATKHFDALQAADQYSDAYYFHGLAVQSAEATAEFVNQHVRRELGLPENRGKRYSWGYPACPDLEDHAQVLKLLPDAASKLGMELTAAYQWIPEQSTAAIFVHHPQAKYYTVGVSRVEQLTNA